MPEMIQKLEQCLKQHDEADAKLTCPACLVGPGKPHKDDCVILQARKDIEWIIADSKAETADEPMIVPLRSST